MCTTVDLPDDLHRLAQAIARNIHSSPSGTIARLLGAALAGPGPVRVETSPRTGLQVASVARVVTSEDVRSLEDDR